MPAAVLRPGLPDRPASPAASRRRRQGFPGRRRTDLARPTTAALLLRHRRRYHARRRAPAWTRSVPPPRALMKDGRSFTDTLTFFEVRRKASMLHFAYRRPRAVLEVGLGVSSTRPASAWPGDVADHEHQLRSRRDARRHARQDRPREGGHHQAGWPRSAASSRRLEAADVIAQPVARRCCRRSARVLAGAISAFTYEPARIESHRPGHARSSRLQGGRYPGLTPALVGEHQAANAAVAVAVSETAWRAARSLANRSIAAGSPRIPPRSGRGRRPGCRWCGARDCARRRLRRAPWRRAPHVVPGARRPRAPLRTVAATATPPGCSLSCADLSGTSS